MLQDASADPASPLQDSIPTSQDVSLENPFDENEDLFDPVQDDDADGFVEVEEENENELS